MEVVTNNFLPGDQRLVEKIVYELKAQGIFDQFRKECFADVDTKPAYQNLRQRVEGSVAGFLRDQSWRPDMNKNQVREMLRKKITESGYLETGVERIVDQVVNPKINSVFLPKVEEVVYSYLGIQKPNRTDIKSEPIDLLPNDLEAVSPESEPVDKKDDKSNDNIQDLDDSKTEEDESPPFEPLDDKPMVIPPPPEENSVDSHMSAFSGLVSHESNNSNENKVIAIEQDSQMSRNSSDSRLSIVTSDENSKMEICEDSQSKSIKSNDSDKNKHKSSEKHKSRSDHKHDKDKKSSKDSRSRHSSSSKDKEKNSEKKESKSSSNKNDKDKKEKEKHDKDRSKSSSSSKHSSHSTKDKNTTKKEPSKPDKDKSKSSKDSKPKGKSSDSSKNKEKERTSSDKHKHSSHSDRHRKDSRDKKKDKSKDDHYSSKDKKNDRRSTDRDSNDGNSNRPNNNGTESRNSHSQSSSQESSNSGNENKSCSEKTENTTKAPVIITGAVEKNEVIISPPETQRVKLFKPKCAANIQEALRLRKIRKQLAKLEKENQLCLATVDIDSPFLLSSSINIEDLKTSKIKEIKENNKKLEEDDIIPAPLQNTVISQDNWDAMEAKLQNEVRSEFKDETEDFNNGEFEKDDGIEDCKYFEFVDLSKIEFLQFAYTYTKGVEKDKKAKNVKRGKTVKRKSVDHNDIQNNNKIPDKKTKLNKNKEKITTYVNNNFSLPLSPAESETSSVGKKEDNTAIKPKRNNTSKMNSQRYSSDDLYKPRPTFASSRRRGAKNLGN